MEGPLVSVIIPSYNHRHFIERCINSVLEQDYKNIQLIVIDDGSTDGSHEVLDQLQQVHHFTVEKQKNRGLSATLNRGITEFAAGRYICVVASDDYWDTNKISEQVRFMESHPDYALVCSRAQIVDAGEHKLGTLGDDIKPADLTFDHIILANKIPALTVMLRKTCLDVVGGYDESLYIEDWDMWIRLAEKYKLGFIDKYLAYYRMHGSNISSRKEKMFEARFKIIGKWKSHPRYKAAYRNIMLERLEYLSVYNKPVAIKESFKYLHYITSPSYVKSLMKIILYKKRV